MHWWASHNIRITCSLLCNDLTCCLCCTLSFKSSRMSGAGYTESFRQNPTDENRWKSTTRQPRAAFFILLFHCPDKNMLRPFNFGVFLCCFLHERIAFVYNFSTSNVSVVEDKDSMDQHSPFLQLRDTLSTYSKLIRPYSLLTNDEDYHYLPKPKQRRPSRLLRLLGPSFDPLWMSVAQPSESTGVWISENDEGAVLRGDTLKPTQHTVGKKFNLRASLQLRLAAENHRLKLLKEAADLDMSSLPSDVANAIRDWLVDSATCGLRYQWVDMGLAFWPRWLRHTDCETTDLTRKCSFPSGMVCKQAQTAQIKILAWICQKCIEKPDASIISIKEDGSGGNGTVENIKMCVWRHVPYPVVTSCECSCK